MGEEAEKANGWGSGRGRGPVAGQAVGCLGCLTSKCAGNINELRSFMVSCFQNWGASQVLGWRNWGWEPSWGAALPLGQGLP